MEEEESQFRSESTLYKILAYCVQMFEVTEKYVVNTATENHSNI